MYCICMETSHKHATNTYRNAFSRSMTPSRCCRRFCGCTTRYLPANLYVFRVIGACGDPIRQLRTTSIVRPSCIDRPRARFTRLHVVARARNGGWSRTSTCWPMHNDATEPSIVSTTHHVFAEECRPVSIKAFLPQNTVPTVGRGTKHL